MKSPKLVFTPAYSFAPQRVVGLAALAGHGDREPRLRVDLTDPSEHHVFYGQERVSVLQQLVEAGVFTRPQADAVLARLADEAEIYAASRPSEEP